MRIIRNIWGKLVKLHSDTIFFETGSNSNGSYIRFAGVQICWNHYLGSQMTTGSAVGNIYQSGPLDWTYPIAFSGNPALFVGVRRTGGQTAWGGHSGGVSSQIATALRIMSTHSTTTGILTPLAIGFY